jgi:putative ABC transport system permease protein
MIHDLRYALRSLLKSPGFTLVAVLILALGIGANTAIFSVVEAVLLRSLPFPEAERLVDIKLAQEAYRRPGGGGGTSPLAAYDRWRTAGQDFADMATYRGGSPILSGLGAAERLRSWSVSANFFSLLGARPLIGRALVSDDDRPGAAPVVVLSHAFWQSRLGGDQKLVGRTITLDTTSYMVVGVMPRDFSYPAGASMWSNLGALLSGPDGPGRARQFGFWVIGRLRPDVTPARAQSDLDVIQRRAWSNDPSSAGWLPVVNPLRDYLVGPVRTSLLIMLGAVGLVLLVACANVASLLLARATARWREVAIRVALGAGRIRVLRETLTESVVLGFLGGAAGLLLALWGVPALVTLAGAELPRFAQVSVDGRVLALCFGAGAIAGFLAGLGPALRAARGAPADVLRAAGTDAIRSGTSRALDALVVVQVALTMVLLAGAGLLTRSFTRLTTLDPGFEPTQVVVAQLQLPAAQFTSDAQRVAYVEQALDRVRAMPGATDAAVASGIPLAGGAIVTATRPGIPERPGQEMAWLSAVTPAFFRTLGIPLERGRGLNASDPGVVLIDDAAARAYFPGEDPMGKQIRFYGGWTRTIVGVVGDTRQEALRAPPPPHIYEPYASDAGGYLKVVVRVAGAPGPAVGALRHAIEPLGPGVPIDQVAPMTNLLADSLARQRLYTFLLLAFATMALALAAAGMYGIVSYGVSRRTREIGIRMAMGAGQRGVLEMVLGRGLVLTFVGLVLGVFGALAATRLLRSFLFEVGPTDPTVLAAAALALVAATLAACWFPARRATKVDPLVALRSE